MKEFEAFLSRLIDAMERHGIPVKEIHEILKEALRKS